MPQRVLIVDDEADVRSLFSAILESAGYLPLTAANGREALDVARATRPCMILLDLMMPVMDGESFRRAQLADPILASIPVVCVSARLNAARTATDLGMQGCVMKPVDPDAIIAAARQHCQ